MGKHKSQLKLEIKKVNSSDVLQKIEAFIQGMLIQQEVEDKNRAGIKAVRL